MLSVKFLVANTLTISGKSLTMSGLEKKNELFDKNKVKVQFIHFISKMSSYSQKTP